MEVLHAWQIKLSSKVPDSNLQALMRANDSGGLLIFFVLFFSTYIDEKWVNNPWNALEELLCFCEVWDSFKVFQPGSKLWCVNDFVRAEWVTMRRMSHSACQMFSLYVNLSCYLSSIWSFPCCPFFQHRAPAEVFLLFRIRDETKTVFKWWV